MFHRLLVVLGGAVLAAVLTSSALAAVHVRVRVEGAHTTIFGASERRLTPVTGTFQPPGGVSVTVSGQTAFGALERASRLGEFFYHVSSTSFGPYVDQIGRRLAAGSTGWVFKVNNVSPPVGADAVKLRKGDRVLWYFARFGASGGPKTLDLAKAGPGCYRAYAYDDNGARTSPARVTFERDGRFVGSMSGRLCPHGSWHELRALKKGMVRSDAIAR
ncbi:MAG TPA: DUF4430 domain-containing protein [Gaiellaceae bacterium]